MKDMQLGHYILIEELGRGGRGEVWLAEDTRLERRVAVKFLPYYASRNEIERQRFSTEAIAAARLSHPNIAQVYEFAEIEERPFLVMEYIEGQSLRDTIRSNPQLPLTKVLDWTRQAANGLAKAHEAGIIHRDIKPENMLITKDGTVKLVDFGLAKLSGQSSVTTKGTTLGTAAYMSPEQARGEEVDHRTDIWSLGVVFYELIVGDRPFRGQSYEAVVFQILSEAPEPIEGLITDIPIGIGYIIEKTLQKHLSDRYQSIDEMLQDFHVLEEEYIGDEKAVVPVPRKKVVSIAVLPFANRSGDPEQEYFCDGLAEEIMNALGKVEGLRVVARTSAFSFKGKEEDIRQIGKKLNVDTVLEGSVRKSGDRLRISTQLSKVFDGYQLWTERFDRDITDVFEIQDEISLAIVENLMIKLLVGEKDKIVKRYTENLQAHNQFLKGRYFWGRRTGEGMERAIIHLEQAIKEDPDYALAHVGLADALSSIGFWSLATPKRVFPKARKAAARALELDPNLAEAHASKAWIDYIYDWNWQEAEKGLRRSIELNPNYSPVHNWYAIYLLFLGRFEEALIEIERALELDPLSLLINANVGLIHFCARDYDTALDCYQKTLEMDNAFGIAHFFTGCVLIQQERYDEAIESLEKAIELTGNLPWAIGSLGSAYALAGQPERALELVQDLEDQSSERYITPAAPAVIYGALGDFDKVKVWAIKALEARDPIMLHTNVFPQFDNMRSEEWFQYLQRKMGFRE